MIEETLERIAVALEESMELRREMLELAKWQREFMKKKHGDLVDNPPPLKFAPMEKQDRQTLMDLCLENGLDVKPTTRTNTLYRLLLELYERGELKDPEHKMSIEEGHSEEAEDAGETSTAEQLPPVTEPPAAAAPAPEKPKAPMTSAQARDILNANYGGTEADKALLRGALKTVGADRFCDVEDGRFEELIATYMKMRGEAANG